MTEIRINVTGDRQVGLRFEEFPDALYADLHKEIDALSAELFARVEAATPSLTGQLRSQERVRVFADKTRITGYVDIAGSGPQDYRKAGALEYGSRGKPVAVSAHTMQLDHYWSIQLATPELVMVQAFSRTPDITAAAFERGPLGDMQPEIIARLNAVVERRAAETNA